MPSRNGGIFPQHEWVSFTDAEATQAAYRKLQLAGAQGIYFGVSAFNTTTRTQEHASGIRAFFFDIDAGEAKQAKHGDKVYASAEEAWGALNAVVDTALPRPTYVVFSGTGIHAYWVATEDFTYTEWKPLAQRLKSWVAATGLRVDQGVTANAATIMRLPGSRHQCGSRAQVLETNALFTKEQLTNAINDLPLQALPAPVVAQPRTGENPLEGYELLEEMRRLTSLPHSFEKIIRLHELTGEGCQALYDIYRNQERQTYLDWIQALSIAKFCVDGDEWIHKISNKYPGYDHAATEAKADSLRGPYLCEGFMENNPDRCAGCPFAGKIRTPLTLGRDPKSMPVKVEAPLGTNKQETGEFIIPPYPAPFYRGVNGGIYFDEHNEKTETVESIEVLKWDFYIYERISSNGKQIYWCRYHSPHDGVREFDMDSSMIHTLNNEMKDCLTGQGIAITGKQQWGLMSLFLSRFNEQLVNSRAALREVTQQGWQTDSRGAVTAFVHGREEITRNGTKPAPIGDKNVAQKFSKALSPKLHKGIVESLEIWNGALFGVYGAKYYTPNQFVICASIGSVFAARYALDGHCGGVISLATPGSGYSKTVTCQTALRVWGDPADMTFSSLSGITNAALMTNLGYLNSIPLLRDEITEMEGYEVADLVYDSTRLGDKERAQNSDNDIRHNRNTWRTWFYTTSNRSIYDVIAADRDDGDGVMMRVTELDLPKIKSERGSHGEYERNAKALAKVHGVAGRVLIEWMVQHPNEAEQMWSEAYEWVKRITNAQASERFWVTHLTSAVVGARIGAELHIHPFRVSDVEEFIVALMQQMRMRVSRRTEHTLVVSDTGSFELVEGDTSNLDTIDDEVGSVNYLESPEKLTTNAGMGDTLITMTNNQIVTEAGYKVNVEFIGEMIQENLKHIVVIRQNGYAAYSSFNAIEIRIDHPRKEMVIGRTFLRAWCVKRNLSLDFVVDVLDKLGAKQKKVRIMAGTDYSSAPAINAWVIPDTDRFVNEYIAPVQVAATIAPVAELPEVVRQHHDFFELLRLGEEP